MPQVKVIAEPGAHDFTVECVVNGPRERVYRAHVDPEAIPHWWGPSFLTTTVERLEPRKGGIWRFVQRDTQGNEYAFNGVYHECIPSERIIRTWEFEGMPGHVLLETVTFEDTPDGKTLLRSQSVFQSVADRDGMLATGATEAGKDMYERLEEYVGQAR